MEDYEAMLSGSFLFHLSVGILLNLFELFCCTRLLPDLLFAQFFIFCETCLPFHFSTFESEYKETILNYSATYM